MVHTFLREEKYAKEALPALTRYLLCCFLSQKTFLKVFTPSKLNNPTRKLFLRGYLTFKVKPSAY